MVVSYLIACELRYPQLAREFFNFYEEVKEGHGPQGRVLMEFYLAQDWTLWGI